VSAISQRLAGLGLPILWWEVPNRRRPDPGEPAVRLPGGFEAPAGQVALVKLELQRIAEALETYTGQRLTEPRLAAGIRRANRVRRLLAELRWLDFTAPACPLPALEMLIAEMLAIHFCSDREESLRVLSDLTVEAGRRAGVGQFAISAEAVRVYWVNPVADLRAMNLLEACGGRLCGSDFMFTHALDLIPDDLPGLEALARTALADPMVGPARDRARRITAECRRNRVEAVVVSRIPGASHCAWEGAMIREHVAEQAGLPVVELEIPPVCDPLLPALRTRLQALMEIARARRAS
jgi:benzoyl-CoA reductase/2-hydroxyglutaryl-CoA dehydratase subunit BcrC/BadD/HgdB